MNTLTVNSKNKELLIKSINKHRLENKNTWYQCNVNFNGYNYKFKAYNTWIQLCCVYRGEELMYKTQSAMELNIKEFKQYLNDIIK